MESTDTSINGGDVTAESKGKKLTDNERTVNSDLHIRIKSSDLNDFMTSNISKSPSVESRATSVAMDVDSSSDKENRERKNSENNFAIDDNDSNIDNLSNKRANRLRGIIDSDSEDDVVTSKSGNKSSSTESRTEVHEKTKNSKAKRRFKINSDSESEDDKQEKNKSYEEDDEDVENIPEELEKVGDKNKSKKFSILIDSESEDDEQEKNKSHEKNDDDFEDIPKEPEKVGDKHKPKKFSTLIDSDSEDESYSNSRTANDPVPEEAEDEGNNSSSNKSKNEKPEKKKKMIGSKRAAKDEAMKQIHSETQRLLREAPVSLPYHRPKQRTLEEFLNRKKITLDLPKGATTVAKMKMSVAIVSQVLKEKEKEAELFYKSDSDSEDENVSDNIQSKNSEKKLSASEELKELETDVIPNELNEEHRARAAASRRLFDGDSCDSSEVKPAPEESMEIDLADEQLSSEKKKSFASKMDSLTIISGSQTNVEKHKNEIDADEVEKDCAEDVSEVVKSSTTVSSSELDKILDKDDEFSSAKMMTDEEIEKLIDEESKMNDNLLSQASKDSLTSDDADKEGEFEPDRHVLGLPLPNFNSPEKKIEISKPSTVNVKKNSFFNIPSVQPKLRGIPGMVIDLTNESKPNKEAVNNLMDRFLMKHSAVNKHVASDQEVTVLQTEVTPEGLKVIKDVLPYKFAANETEDPELNKPGAKLVRLKEDLMKKMASRRNEEWRQKEQEAMDEENEEEEEEDEFEEKNSKLDDDDDDDDEDAAESEPEEDDIPIKENKRKHCDFGDEEAEVSEDENVELSAEENEEDNEEIKENDEDHEEEDEDEDEDEDEEEDDDEEKAEENEEENKTDKPKKFSRIVAVDDDDSNSADEKINGDVISERKQTLERTNTDIDIFADDEEDLPSYQLPQNDAETNSPIYKTPLTPSHPQSRHSRLNQFSFFSSKSLNVESPAKSLPSQMNSWDIDNIQTQRNESQRKLFQTQDKVVTDEELMALCSGNFTDSNNTQLNNFTPKLTGLVDSKNDKPISESQILSMCSGKFGTQASEIDEASQDFKLTFDENSQSHSDNDLKKKLQEKETKMVPWKSLDIASSSEDEDIGESNEKKSKKKVLKKKKKVKQLVLSDDEEDRNQVNSNDEEEDEDIEESEDEEKFIDYDSEENEVVVVPKKDIKKVAANFLEAEAELSESEWGSEDEDEKGLDKLELEAGDDEEIDEDQMRDQLGKMHARQVLDDDQRDVRMLKELLFEDGDLHTDGSVRERKFKWKNIDRLTEEILLKPMDEDDDDHPIDPNEIANDMEWRKFRLEREKFLEEKIKSADDDLLRDEITSGGKLFKLGMKVLKKKGNNFEQKSVKITSNKTIIPRTVSELMGTPVGEKSKLLHNAMKKGSFLARGDEALARLAVVIKQTDNVVLAPKHSKNFIFTHLSPSVNDAEVDSGHKETQDEEKADDKTRKRKSTTGGTPRSTKKAKTEGNRLGKKLF